MRISFFSWFYQKNRAPPPHRKKMIGPINFRIGQGGVDVGYACAERPSIRSFRFIITSTESDYVLGSR
jgi:hypothetical protein